MKFVEYAGSFSKGPDWTVIRDIRVKNGMVHDLRILPIPGIEDESIDGVYSEHFIEHLTKEEGINIFKESLRILKPGGTIRTLWPSMDFIEFLQSDEDLTEHPFVDWYYKCIIRNESPFNKKYYSEIQTDLTRIQDLVALRMLHQEGEHKHLWYKDEMIETLKELGYKDVKEQEYQVSSLQEFNNIDNKRIPVRKYESCVIEARK